MDDNILITTIDSLRDALTIVDLNAMEMAMANRLLLGGYKFFIQYKLGVDELGWETITGRKSFILDFFLPIGNNADGYFKQSYKNGWGDIVEEIVEGMSKYIKGIVIETEGKIHSNEDTWIKDRDRFTALVSNGYIPLRFGWHDVMNYDKDNTWVESTIRETINKYAYLAYYNEVCNAIVRLTKYRELTIQNLKKDTLNSNNDKVYINIKIKEIYGDGENCLHICCSEEEYEDLLQEIKKRPGNDKIILEYNDFCVPFFVKMSTGLRNKIDKVSIPF